MTEETRLEDMGSQPSATEIRERMEQAGWCPHQIKYAMQTYESEVLLYLATINRSGFRDVDHRKCARKRRCVAMNSDMKNYITRHVAPTCSCEMVAVAYEKLIKILSESGVPLIAIRKDQDQNIRLHVEPRTLSSRYIAISHVWADGLGNPSQNGLPCCQLKRLQTQLGNLPLSRENAGTYIGKLLIDYKRFHISISRPHSTPLFWMDTLCIPVKEEDKLLRKQAINQMASVYAAAVQVLVLDSELCQCTTDSVSATDILARIWASSWMTRSWTLQEGVLARECVYQFADAAIDPFSAWCLSGLRKTKVDTRAVSFNPPQNRIQDKVYRTLYKMLWNQLHQEWKSSLQLDQPTLDLQQLSAKYTGLIGLANTIKQAFTQCLGTFRKRKKHRKHFIAALSEQSRVNQLVQTWNELTHRCTTQLEDIVEILANLLDFHAAPVMRLGNMGDGIALMLFSFKELPVSLLFNTGPRYRHNQDHLNRWLPVVPSDNSLDSTPTMRFTNTPIRGLLIDRTSTTTDLLVFIISPPILDPSTFLLRVAGSEFSHIIDCDRPEADEFDTTKFSSTCIMFRKSTDQAVAASTRGACFHVSKAHESDNSYLHLIFDCPLRVRRYTMHSDAQDLGSVLAADLDTSNDFTTYTAVEVPAIVKIILRYGMLHRLVQFIKSVNSASPDTVF